MPKLFSVTTPIGNSEDITLRALNVLKQNKNIFCEDTRVFKDLCRRLQIDFSDKKIYSFHDHSSEKQIESILKLLETVDCVYVSDAGSPVISDPAYPLLKECFKREIEVDIVSGISSVTASLEVSGLAPTPFHFHGFLQREKSAVENFVDLCNQQYGTHIIFEGVSRVQETLKILTKKMPSYEFAVVRELTKEYESVYRFIGRDFESIIDKIVYKGEFVILIRNPIKKGNTTSSNLVETAEQIIAKGPKPKLISKLISQITNKDAKEIYSLLNKK